MDAVELRFVEKNIKIGSVLIRATPIMESLTGLMIAGFIIFSGKLIANGELGVNNFFSFLYFMSTHFFSYHFLLYFFVLK